MKARRRKGKLLWVQALNEQAGTLEVKRAGCIVRPQF